MPTQCYHFDIYEYIVIEVGDPSCSRVFRRHQPLRGLWRSPEDHRRPDRAGLDSTLYKRNRATGPAAVRVRRLTFLLNRFQ